MRSEAGVLGVFVDTDQAAQAIRDLRQSGHGDVRASLAAPFPAVIGALDRPRSWLDQAILSGVLLGAIAGFLLCSMASVAWPLVTGGKPIVSVPPFVVVALELGLLMSAVTIVVSLLIASLLGGRRRPVPGELPTSGDAIRIFVPGGDAHVRAMLVQCGATEVRDVG